MSIFQSYQLFLMLKKGFNMDKIITVKEAKYANQFVGTDIYPFEIIRKVSDKTLEIREMKARKANLNFEQDWDFLPDEDKPVIRIRLTKGGLWKDADGGRYRLDVKPRRYHDYGF